jgi:uncharacterized membrane protein YbhN (UPF0104 family)
MMPAPDRTLRERLSPVGFAGLAALLAIAVAALLAWQVAGFPEVLEVVRHPQLAWIGLAALGELVAYLGYTLAYRAAVQASGGPKLPLRRAGALVTAGFGAHVPGGGFAGDLRALRGECVDDRDAAARVLGLGALEYALLAPVATAAAAFLLADGADVPLSVTVPWVAAVPLGFALAVWVSERIDPARVERLPRRLAGPAGSALAALALLRGLVVTPVKHAGAWVGIAAYWAGDIFCLWAGLHAFGADPTVPATIVAYATGYIASRRSLPLAGAAATEALLALALTWVGVPFVYALVGVVTYRVFNFLLAMPMGLLADWGSRKRLRARTHGP